MLTSCCPRALALGQPVRGEGTFFLALSGQEGETFRVTASGGKLNFLSGAPAMTEFIKVATALLKSAQTEAEVYGAPAPVPPKYRNLPGRRYAPADIQNAAERGHALPGDAYNFRDSFGPNDQVAAAHGGPEFATSAGILNRYEPIPGRKHSPEGVRRAAEAGGALAADAGRHTNGFAPTDPAVVAHGGPEFSESFEGEYQDIPGRGYSPFRVRDAAERGAALSADGGEFDSLGNGPGPRAIMQALELLQDRLPQE